METTYTRPEPVRDTCCQSGAYLHINTFKANPFDDRVMPFQKNQWCSNELLLRDPEMRCDARVQPLDLGLHKGTSHAHKYNLAAGFQ
jgi:hypothetical protein